MVESNTILRTLDDFSNVSGQIIGPAKSSLWFSKPTRLHLVQQIAALFQVTLISPSVNYLGAPIATSSSAFDFLIEAFSSRLNIWKSKMLSQAGRVVLIKAVLLSIPIYFMTTAKVPQAVLNKLTGLVRRFFWDKVDKSRYLALLSWDKVAAPIGMGGLGLRDLAIMNQALLMKMLWRLAAGSEALWATQLRAKYLPNSDLWHSKRFYRCTSFWRAILTLREKLQHMVTWQLGDGTVCSIFAQPWFPGALQHCPQINADRRLRVFQLVDQQTGNWDVGAIASYFGYTATMQIVSGVKPPSQNEGIDRLIFTHGTNGRFSVRLAYGELAKLNLLPRHSLAPATQQGLKKLWHHIWYERQTPPRLRLFVWKLAQGALPLGKTMCSRLGKGNSLCTVCGEAEEDEMHVSFLCPFARSCWFGCNLALRTDGFNLSIKEMLQWLMEESSSQIWQDIMISLWCMWRCRNDWIFQGKRPTYEAFSRYRSGIQVEVTLANSMGKPGRETTGTQPVSHQEEEGGLVCHVDGSWAFGWVGGAGFLFQIRDSLIVYCSERIKACCAIQAEASALQRAMDYAIRNNYPTCQFISDCQGLVNACNSQQPPVDVDWRAHKEMYDIWKKLKCNAGFTCTHIGREQNELADSLAKHGRLLGGSYEGFTFPTFPV